MKLQEILQAVDHVAVTGPVNPEILGIAYDSRRVRPGYLFAALPGHDHNGADFIGDAANRGAVAVMSTLNRIEQNAISHIRVEDSRKAVAEIACVFYGNPAAGLQVIGITGTNGKTTASFMIRDILAADGRHPGLIGTIRYEIGSRVIPATRTTPEAPDLQRMLAEMLQAECRSAVMEITSHALAQKRVWGIDLDAAVFTNLTHDHLDYHGSMEEYFQAKSLLFRRFEHGEKKSVAVVNADDPWGLQLLQMKELQGRTVTYGCGQQAMVRAENIRLGGNGSEFNMRTPWGDASVRLNLMGRFNISNALAAIGACGALGISPSLMASVLANCGSVPGRMEEIPTGKGFQVFVDYAHTDDALNNVLQTLREIEHHDIILVFGCGGNRDRTKRPVMGAVAARLADYSIVTSDNPRKEDPMEIIAQIKEGFAGHDNFHVVADRAQAIQEALELAQKGDIVLIAGKGHETFQELANTTIPFDDRQVVKKMVNGQWLMA